MDPIEAMLFNVLNQDETPQTTARERFVAGLRQSGRTEEDIREIMEVYDRVH